jgi:hypothetical protein
MFSLHSSHCGGGWTLYSLSLPSPPILYTDILCVASAHQWSSPTTYRHLLCEGHIILRTALTTSTWMPGSSEALSRSYDDEFRKTLEEMYRDSCALLADYYIMWVQQCSRIGRFLWTAVNCQWRAGNILAGWVHIDCSRRACPHLGIDVHGSVHHSTIHIKKIQQDAAVYQNLFHIYMKLNTFWATHHPSSGA